jgi:hypothetical protein
MAVNVPDLFPRINRERSREGGGLGEALETPGFPLPRRTVRKKWMVCPAAKFTSHSQLSKPLPPPAGGRGKGEEADEADSSLPTSPSPAPRVKPVGLRLTSRRGPPIPPKGGEGLFSVNFRLRNTAPVQPHSIPRTALRFRGGEDPRGTIRVWHVLIDATKY